MTAPDPRHYLDAYRDAEDPSPERMHTVFANLERAVGDLPDPPDSGSPAGIGVLGKAAVVATVVGLASAAALLVGRPPSEPLPVAGDAIVEHPAEGARAQPPVIAPGSDSPGVPPSEERAVAEEPVDRASDPQAHGTAPRRPADVTPPPRRSPPLPAQGVPDTSPEPEDPLLRDVRLIKAARAAIVGHRFREALVHIRDHAAAFPDSQLARERTVLEAEALCGSGENTRGERVAAAFIARHPTSPLVGRARRACAND